MNNMGEYSKYNAVPVYKELEKIIKRGQNRNIETVYEKLSIFDWFKDRLSMHDMECMRTFLQEAIKLGFTGYVCFKVGASGCANGMWAHKSESENGFSPNGACLYRSFTPSYTYWSFCDDNGKWVYDDDENMEYDSLKTVYDLENAWVAEKIKCEV